MINRKSYEELTFTDDFMFCHILENRPDLCLELAQLILDRPIGQIVDMQKQHVVDTVYDARGVRFDIHFKDEMEKVYSMEMQTYAQRELLKRDRFYTSQMDLEQLDKGCRIADLKDTYVIFICTFNIAEEYGLAKYTFSRTCEEKPEYRLEDGSHLIIVCAENDDPHISDGLKNFLSFIAGHGPSDEFTSKLQTEVVLGQQSQEWRREYMLMTEYVEEVRAEGRTEGRTEGIAEKAKKTAKKLFDRGDSLDSIADVLETDKATVESWLGQKTAPQGE